MNRLCMLLAVVGISCATPPALRSEQQTGPNSYAPSVAAQDSSGPTLVTEHLTVDGKAVGHRVEARDGEVCLTCGKPITKNDVTYMVDGQRVAAHKGACVGALAAQPAEWLAKLKPRGAFLDAGAATLGLSSGWLFLGLYVLSGLIFSALAAHRAFSAGRDPLFWLIVGFLTNVVGFAVLLTLPRQELHALAGIPAGLGKVAATYSPEACLACGAENHPSARVCSGCRGALTPRIVSDVQRAGLSTH